MPLPHSPPPNPTHPPNPPPHPLPPHTLTQDARELLYKLEAEGVVTSQELHRPNEMAPSRSFYTWHVKSGWPELKEACTLNILRGIANTLSIMQPENEDEDTVRVCLFVCVCVCVCVPLPTHLNMHQSVWHCNNRFPSTHPFSLTHPTTPFTQPTPSHSTHRLCYWNACRMHGNINKSRRQNVLHWTGTRSNSVHLLLH